MLVSCQEKSSPESVLRDFEKQLSKASLDSTMLSRFFTKSSAPDHLPPVHEKGEALMKKINIIYSNCANRTCSYTYDVTYKIKSKKSESVMDVRKQVILKEEASLWKIDSLQIIKSYLENKKPINIQ